jgi:hypothetical protein
MKSLIILLFAVTATLACEDTGPELEPALLVNCWKHSFEEDDHLRIQTFRTCDQHLPSAEVRYRIILKENNEAEYLVFADDDANYMTSGTWDYREDNRHLTIYDTEGLPVLKYRVEDVQSDVLRLWMLDEYF